MKQRSEHGNFSIQAVPGLRKAQNSEYKQVRDPHTVKDEASQYHIQGKINKYCDALPKPERFLLREPFISTAKTVTSSSLNT